MFPVRFAAGGQYKLSKDTTMTYGVEFKRQTNWQLKWAHQVDKNLKVTGTQQFECSRLGSKQSPYDLGFDIAYTL